MAHYTADDVAKAGDGGLPPEGYYLAEIVSEGTEERISKRTGDPMINVAFKDVQTGSFLCYDIIMLGGRGLGIGHQKMLMLGAVDPEAREFNVSAFDLIGRRAVLKVVHEQYEKNGQMKTTCKVDFDADNFGYADSSTWSEQEFRPDGSPASFGAPTGNETDVPF